MSKLTKIVLSIGAAALTLTFCFFVSVYTLAAPAAPELTALEGVSVTIGGTASLEIEVTSSYTELNYQWYMNTSESTIGGTLIADATEAVFDVPTDVLGLKYYYVIVTDNDAGSERTATSNVVPVLVTDINLPNELSIDKVYESDTWFDGGKVGNTIYQGGRVTLVTEYYTGLNAAPPAGSSFVFRWYTCANPADPMEGRKRAPSDKWDMDGVPILEEADGNSYIPDTSAAGTTYYYVEMTYSPPVNGGVPVTIRSEVIELEITSITGTREEGWLTPAELSGWRLTSTSEQVYSYCEDMVDLGGGRLRLVDMADTAGSVVRAGLRVSPMVPKKVPMLIIGYPKAPASYEEAIAAGKTIALVNCNIHSGEVEGKESMLIFAREIALGYHDSGLLNDLVILLIPNFNADGNDDWGLSRNNTQYTPRFVGTRYTGALWNPAVPANYNTPQTGESNNYIHFNINRDMTKLDGQEAAGMVAVMNEWDPVIFIDAHATNGSLMRHPVTYNWGLHPNTDPALLEYNRERFSELSVGPESYLHLVQGKPAAVPYGNFSGTSGRWNTFDAVPRYTTNYAGLRNRLAMLLEVYSHDPYTVRVDTQYACIYGILQTVQAEKDIIATLIANADEYSINRAAHWETNGQPDDISLMPLLVPLEYGEHYSIKPDGTMDVVSYKVTSGTSVINTVLRSNGTNGAAATGGLRVGTLYAGEEDINVINYGKFEFGDTVPMGAYYLFDADCEPLLELMQKHGIEVTQLTAPLTLDETQFQWFDVTSISKTDPTVIGSYYEGRRRSSSTTNAALSNIQGDWAAPTASQEFPVGTYIVSTAQIRGALAALLLEPASIDGAACWCLIDDEIRIIDNPDTVRSNAAYACEVEDYSGAVTIAMPVFKITSFSTIAEVTPNPPIVSSPDTSSVTRTEESPASDASFSSYVNPFIDVTEANWFYPNVQFVVENGLFDGTSATTFSPNSTITRGMLVTALWRLDGSPTVSTKAEFSDLQSGAYYEQAVNWAAMNDIVKGYGNGLFGPNDSVTREQVVTILERYMTFKDIDIAVTHEFRVFADGDSVSSWAVSAVQLMSKLGVINGKPGNLFDPRGNATRAEAAAMLHRFADAVK